MVEFACSSSASRLIVNVMNSFSEIWIRSRTLVASLPRRFMNFPDDDKSMYHVYILECADGSLYTGMTSNIEQRLVSHNNPQMLSRAYTATRTPVTLAASWEVCCKSCARSSEVRIKKLGRAGRFRIISSPDLFTPRTCC